MIPPVLPTYARAPIAFERGEGTRVFTADGQEYLDFGAGVAVTSCGHAHPHLVEALTEQARKIWHTSNLYQMPGQEKLARRLADRREARVERVDDAVDQPLRLDRLQVRLVVSGPRSLSRGRGA